MLAGNSLKPANETFTALVLLTAAIAWLFQAIPVRSGEVVRPAYVKALELHFGQPNQDGIGSTVLFDQAADLEVLQRLSLEKYRYFLGPLWERFGETAWLAPWRIVLSRKGSGDIVSELHAITDAQAAMSADTFLEAVSEPVAARTALAAAFDDPEVEDVVAYNLGDGEAYSGLLLAARRKNDEAVFVVFMLD
jgi:hypothetical protein